MSDNLYLELSERSKQILKGVVESYLETGEPAGSETILKKVGIDISSASIRSILADLQKEGLLYAPHTSAGRLPTDKGMRFFVDGLLEFGRLSKNEQENIKNQCQSKGSSFQDVLNEASKTISGLSNCAGIVVAPKFQNKIKHIEFIRLNANQIMSIIASENGLVENRILNSKNKLDTIATKLVKEGIIEIVPNLETPYIFLHGQSSLLEEEVISKDLDQIRNLFDDIEDKSNFLNIIENTSKGQGVQIFIGSQNFLFKHSGLSMVIAPYKNKEQKIIGAIGVVGPVRLNYAKIVPLVDYTSKIVGKILS